MFRKVIQMPRTRNVIYGFLAAAAMAWGQSTVAPAPKAAHKAPTPADWAALGKLPDFTGVWEVAMGGGGARGGGRGAPGAPGAPAAPAPAGRGRAMAAAPALTPEYAAKAKELASASTTDRK